MGIGYIRGLQGHDEKFLKAAACVKHIAVHSGPEGIRHSFNAVVGKQDLYETYLAAFKACVQEGHVEAVMGAYNCINGVPCCVQNGYTGFERFLEILSIAPDIEDKPDAVSVGQMRGEIEFRDV